MNVVSSINQQNISLDSVLTKYGSTIFLDTFNLYPYTIISTLGFLLSTLSLVVFMNRKEFDGIRLYVYLRVYSINNMILCFVNIFNFTFCSYRILSWSNSFPSQVFFNYLFTPISSVCYFYGSVLDILILMDRISFFCQWLKASRFNQLSPTSICVWTLIVCIIIDAPSFVYYEIEYQTFRLDATRNFTIWFSKPSTNKILTILEYMVMAIRDILVLLIEVWLHITSIVLFKKHLKRKKQISLKMCKSLSSSQTGTANPLKRMSVFRSSVRNRRRQGSAAEQKVTSMIAIVCTMTIAEHAVNVTCVLYSFYHVNLTTFVFYTLSDFLWPLKRFILFFVFYSFNSKFRSVLHSYRSVIKTVF